MGHTGPHRDEQCRQGRNKSDSEEIQEPTEEDEATESWTDNIISDFTSVWNKDPRVHKFKEYGHQRISTAAVLGRGNMNREFVRRFCEERGYVHER